MNLRFVEAFYWAASLKSISRAAEKLFITQSATSSRIAALEEELGAMLLDRREKQVRLTMSGARFFVYAQRLLDLQRQAKAEMGGAVARTIQLRIGAIESVLHFWLTDWIQEMRRASPDIELELAVETTPILVEQLQRGTLDIAIAALPAAGDTLRSCPLPPMEMAFVGNPSVHRKRRYTLQDLAALELLTFQRGSQPHVALVDLFRGAGLEARRIHAISSISAMVQLVEQGFGVATLPLAAVQRMARRSPLKTLRCDQALQPLPIHLSYREDPTSSATKFAANALLAFIGDVPGPSKKSMQL